MGGLPIELASMREGPVDYKEKNELGKVKQRHTLEGDMDLFKTLDDMLKKDGQICIKARECEHAKENCPHGKPHFLYATCRMGETGSICCMKSGFEGVYCKNWRG